MGGSVLGGLSPEIFLRDYWQKRPLLVRQAFENYVSPLTPDDLMELACDEDVVSRLILESGGQHPWELITGPFEKEEFGELPDSKWTLLINEVDRHVAAAADVMTPFRFLPNWRFSDVQVSYAPGGGSAGPHVDNYDVFLMQGKGRRHWMIGHTPAPADVSFQEDLDVALLEQFIPDVEWILNPGDVLYLPPRFPHWGIALDPCMTYSVGFRAPSPLDLLHGLIDPVARKVEGAARFSDPGRTPSPHPGRIDAADLAWVRQGVRSFEYTDQEIDRWFGRYITSSSPDEVIDQPPWTRKQVVQVLASGATLQRLAVSHFAYIPYDQGTRLYACGEEHTLPASMEDAVKVLTGTSPLTHDTLKTYFTTAGFTALLAKLVNSGCLVVDRS